MWHVLVINGLTFIVMAEEVRRPVSSYTPPSPPTPLLMVPHVVPAGPPVAPTQPGRPASSTTHHATRRTWVQAFGRRIPFAMLEDVKARFLAAHGSAQEVRVPAAAGGGGGVGARVR